VMKIFLLFYMCHFAMGLTHCYKTTVFFYIYSLIYIEIQEKRIKIKWYITVVPGSSKSLKSVPIENQYAIILLVAIVA